MAYRFTNTDKWEDSWFSNLKQIEMLLFMYLCDNCDIAGFAEINLKRWASDLNSNPDTIEGALKGLQRGVIISKNGDAVYLRNFLKHQKNLPINTNNKAHVGILRRFELYRYKFDIQDINEFIERGLQGGSMPLQRGTGNGIGIGIGIKGGVGGNEKTEKEKSEKEKEYDRFNEWIDKTIPLLRKISNQITYEEYCRMTERYNGDQIRVILTKIANYKLSPKKYSYVNLTFYDWAKKEYNG